MIHGSTEPSVAPSCHEAFTDEELMIRFYERAGDHTGEDLFNELFRRYQRRVLSWCFRFTGDRELAIDLTQEIFLKAYRHQGSYRGDSRLSTWLYAVTRNHCMTSVKSRSTEPTSAAEMIPIHLRDAKGMEPYAAVERKQTFQNMWELIAATLDPLEARIMVLHYGQEMPLATITRALGLSNPSGAKAYIVNARRKLSGALSRRKSTSSRVNTLRSAVGDACRNGNGGRARHHAGA